MMHVCLKELFLYLQTLALVRPNGLRLSGARKGRMLTGFCCHALGRRSRGDLIVVMNAQRGYAEKRRRQSQLRKRLLTGLGEGVWP